MCFIIVSQSLVIVFLLLRQKRASRLDSASPPLYHLTSSLYIILCCSFIRKERREKVETCTNTAYGVVPVRMVPVREEPEYEVVGLPQMSS